MFMKNVCNCGFLRLSTPPIKNYERVSLTSIANSAKLRSTSGLVNS